MLKGDYACPQCEGVHPNHTKRCSLYGSQSLCEVTDTYYEREDESDFVAACIHALNELGKKKWDTFGFPEFDKYQEKPGVWFVQLLHLVITLCWAPGGSIWLAAQIILSSQVVKRSFSASMQERIWALGYMREANPQTLNFRNLERSVLRLAPKLVKLAMLMNQKWKASSRKRNEGYVDGLNRMMREAQDACKDLEPKSDIEHARIVGQVARKMWFTRENLAQLSTIMALREDREITPGEDCPGGERLVAQWIDIRGLCDQLDRKANLAEVAQKRIEDNILDFSAYFHDAWTDTIGGETNDIGLEELHLTYEDADQAEEINIVDASSTSCFCCHKVGHTVRTCPQLNDNNNNSLFWRKYVEKQDAKNGRFHVPLRNFGSDAKKGVEANLEEEDLLANDAVTRPDSSRSRATQRFRKPKAKAGGARPKPKQRAGTPKPKKKLGAELLFEEDEDDEEVLVEEEEEYAVEDSDAEASEA